MGIPGVDAVARFQANEQRFDDFLNVNGTYLDKNGNPVETLPSLANTVAGMTLTVEYLGNWATATVYGRNKVVKHNDINYISILAHTSGTFATDLAAGKWQIYKPVLAEDLKSPLANLGSSLVSYKSQRLNSALTNLLLKNYARVDLIDYMTETDFNNWLANPATFDLSSFLQNAIDSLITGGEINLLEGQLLFGSPINLTANGFYGTCSFATNQMTVVSTISGTPKIGDIVIAAGIAPGTTIISGTGPFTLSSSPGTIAVESVASYGKRFFYGITINGKGNRVTTINGVHSGHIFDCTGAQFLTFKNFAVTGSGVKTAFLFARNSTHNSSGQCRMESVSTRGSFSVAAIYNYAAEEFRTKDCFFANQNINTPTAIFTDDNTINPQSSDFVTIDSGHQSNTVFEHIGSSFMNDQPSGNAPVLSLRGVGAWVFRDGFMTQNPASGSKYVDIDCSGYLNTNLTFDNFMFDAAGAVIDKGFYIHGAGEIQKLTINQFLNYGVKSGASGGLVLHADTGTTLNAATLTEMPIASWLQVYQVDYSNMSLPSEKLKMVYSCVGNKIHIGSANITIDRPDLSQSNEITYSDTGATSLRSEALNPYTQVWPLCIGERFIDTTAYTGNTCDKTVWTSIGVSQGSWVVTGSALCHGAGSPVGVVVPGFKGQEYLNDTDNKWWKSYGTLNSQWLQITN